MRTPTTGGLAACKYLTDFCSPENPTLDYS